MASVLLKGLAMRYGSKWPYSVMLAKSGLREEWRRDIATLEFEGVHVTFVNLQTVRSTSLSKKVKVQNAYSSLLGLSRTINPTSPELGKDWNAACKWK
jgi:hypothetical protein